MKRHERLIIISGLSGSGKSTAIKVLEDMGFYCVDNLPLALLPTFINLAKQSEEGLKRVAMGIDIREREFLREFPKVWQRLRRKAPIELLFFESSRKVLVRRFSETRRRHPLASGGPLSGAIEREIAAMAGIRNLADRIIDTSDMTVHDLKKLLTGGYGTGPGKHTITISLISFGYKYGLPFEADIILDVRFLPNPHFIEELRRLTGRNAKVRKFIFDAPLSSEFLQRIEDLILYLLPHYIAEGKSYLLIGFGCTGGRHRSVALVEEMKKRLAIRGYHAQTTHRDVQKEA